MSTSAELTEIDRTVIEHACSRLVVQFTNALDDHNPDQLLAMWHDDGVWESPFGRAVGKTAIHEMLSSVPSILERHLISNILVEAIDRDHAAGSARLTYYRASNVLANEVAQMQGATLLADHFDRYVRTPQGWKFAQRKTVYVLRQPPKP
jgi:hypothetical protein